MKRLTMLLIFLVVGAIAGGGYWYWQQSASGATPERKAKGKGQGKGGGPLLVKTARAVVKPMPVLIEAVGTVEATTEIKDGMIVDEIQRGYLLNGRFIRPSRVRIAQHETEDRRQKSEDRNQKTEGAK